MYKIKIHKKAQKFLDKVEKQDKSLLCKIEQKISLLSKWLIIWIPLQQPFKQYNVKKITQKYKKSDYRILYVIKSNKLYILVIAERENIYKTIDTSIIKRILNE